MAKKTNATLNNENANINPTTMEVVETSENTAKVEVLDTPDIQSVTIATPAEKIGLTTLDEMAKNLENKALNDVIASNDTYTSIELHDSVTLSNGQVTSTLKLRNATDIDTIRKIQGYQSIGRVSAVRIAVLFASLIDNGFLARNAVFSGIGDLGAKMFGFKASSASVYYSIGKNFFNPDGTAVKGIFEDMSIGQLQELSRIRDNDGKISIELISEFIEKSGISEYSKALQIREKIYNLGYAVKNEKKKIAKKDGETSDTPNGENTTAETTDTANGENIPATSAENTPSIDIDAIIALIEAKSPATIAIIQAIATTHNLDLTDLLVTVQADIVNE